MAKTDAATVYVGAYLIEGSAATLERLIETLVQAQFIDRASPDLFMRTYRSFGIDDARDLRDRAQRKAVSREGRVFAFFAPGMTTDAQNALLKVLEEPPAGAVFFIVVPSPHTMLPTLRSRTQTLHIEKQLGTDADAFLAATPPQRLEMLKAIYEHDDDEGRDMGKVLSFLEGLEARFAKEKPTSARQEGLLAVYRARKYASDKGSLLKPLLEQIALLTPRI